MSDGEAKFPPSEFLEPGPSAAEDLPHSYGKRRVVLLPVDPYLIYAYWQLASDPPPTAGARAVLRFQEANHSFDVEIDLGAGKAYVHLWSPAKTCRADLGLRAEDGSFIPLAQSNVVRTPPAYPAPAAPDLPPSAESPLTPQTQPTPRTQVGPRSHPSRSLRPAARSEAIPVAQPEIAGDPRKPTPSAEPIPPEQPSASPQAEPSMHPPAPLREPVDVAGRWRQKLEELFTPPTEPPAHATSPVSQPLAAAAPGSIDFRLSPVDVPAPVAEFSAPLADHPFELPPPFDFEALLHVDLTEYAEQRFTPGVASGVNQPEGSPLDR